MAETPPSPEASWKSALIRIAHAVIACIAAGMASHLVGHVTIDRALVAYCALMSTGIEVIGWGPAAFSFLFVFLKPRGTPTAFWTLNWDVVPIVTLLTLVCYGVGAALAHRLLLRRGLCPAGPGVTGLLGQFTSPRRRPASAVALPDSSAPPDRPDILLLRVTYDAWRSGKLDILSSSFARGTATQDEQALMADILRTAGPMLRTVAERPDIRASEFVVALGKGEFVMTNRAIYRVRLGAVPNDEYVAALTS